MEAAVPALGRRARRVVRSDRPGAGSVHTLVRPGVAVDVHVPVAT